MSHTPTDRRERGESVGHLLSLGLTQLSIQVTLSTSLTASALGFAAPRLLVAYSSGAPDRFAERRQPGYTRVTVSDSATHTQTTVHETVGVDESKVRGPEHVDKQRIVPGGIPVVPKWLMKLLHLA